MKVSKVKGAVRSLLAPMNIQMNGSKPWDIQVHNPDFYDRVVSGGSLALGESYMDGWWDCRALDRLFDRLLTYRLDKKIRKSMGQLLGVIARAKIANAQRKSKAYVIGKHHYDTGNTLFSLMLDSGLNYSCGYWGGAENLEEAQQNKLDLICRKMGLKPGMKVLDIGCGWGGFARYAAETYGVSVYGITVSKEQMNFARKACRGLDVKIDMRDYRDLNEKFDRIVSVGMFEHVGYKNYDTYMKTVHRCLADDGLFLLHTIAGNSSVSASDPWISKYIFPNSMLPSMKQISLAAERFFVMEDWHSFGEYYDKTLMAWYENFNRNWSKLKSIYDERFYRMWNYYLLVCAASFRSRRNQLWQIVFSKDGIKGGYRYEKKRHRAVPASPSLS